MIFYNLRLHFVMDVDAAVVVVVGGGGVALNYVAVFIFSAVVAVDVADALAVADALVVADALAVVVGKPDRLDD